MSPVHHITHSLSTKQFSFSATRPPILTVPSGATVTFDNTNATFHKINPSTTTAEFASLNPQGLSDIESIIGPIYVDGPVYVESAESGDILKVEILDLQTGPWGWSAIFPGLGLLKDEIPGPYLKTFELPGAVTATEDRRDYVVFKPGVVHIPACPFYGTMGVAPAAEAGDAHPLFPRNDFGGNFDCRYWGLGSTILLRVNVKGALFSVGDAHFSQGDGEITGTALETTMRSRIRLTVVKLGEEGWLHLRSPHYVTDPERTAALHRVRNKGDYSVLATAPDRENAVKEAARGVLDWLEAEKGLSRVEGYMLFSIAGNLKMMQDLGLELYTVSASIPLGLFVDGKGNRN